MKRILRALTAGGLAFLMLVCLSLYPALAQQTDSSGEQRFPRAPLATVKYIGTVVITKKGYQSARKSSTDSTVVFRVHYGERYLCTGDTGNGWYKIVLPDGRTAYVSSNPENTSLLSDEVEEKTLSNVNTLWAPFFKIKSNKKLDVYSQPKSSAQSRRVSSDGVETTYTYPKGTTLYAFGKTTRGNKDWYLVQSINEGIDELAWVLAADCEVIYGSPDNFLIPDWWYD